MDEIIFLFLLEIKVSKFLLSYIYKLIYIYICVYMKLSPSLYYFSLTQFFRYPSSLSSDKINNKKRL